MKRLKKAFGPPEFEDDKMIVWSNENNTPLLWSRIILDKDDNNGISLTIPFNLSEDQHWFYLIFLSRHFSWDWISSELTIRERNWRRALLLAIVATDPEWKDADPISAQNLYNWLNKHHSDRRLWEMYKYQKNNQNEISSTTSSTNHLFWLLDT